MSNSNDLGLLVRQSRDLLGLSQEKFAGRLGVAFASVNRWENGKAKPSPLALKQIEDLLKGLGPKGRDLLAQYFPEEA